MLQEIRILKIEHRDCIGVVRASKLVPIVHLVVPQRCRVAIWAPHALVKLEQYQGFAAVNLVRRIMVQRSIHYESSW